MGKIQTPSVLINNKWGSVEWVLTDICNAI